MNQKQREFLLDAIDKQYRRESESLRDRRPRAPSLNNYLVAAILDGSFILKDPSEVRDIIRTRVRELGKGDTLTHASRDMWGRKRHRDDEDDTEMLHIPALLLFDAPPGYVEARREFEAKLADWEREEKALEAAHNAMRIKIQIGSDKALASLVDQADTLCSLSLADSSRLLLSAPKEVTS